LKPLSEAGRSFGAGMAGARLIASISRPNLWAGFDVNGGGLASIALTTDSSILTAIGNDYGFDEIFSRQVEALCTPQDVVVGISTSGNSSNVCAALSAAKKIGAFTVSLTGAAGGQLAAMCDARLKVASNDTARIQEAHILIGHMLCEWVELAISSGRVLTEEE
jgi:phosphoheptose isomerase